VHGFLALRNGARARILDPVMRANATIRWLAVPILAALPRVMTTGQTAAPATIWAAVVRNYGLKDEAQALAYKKNPVDELAPLAAAKAALIHVVGDADKVVPPEESTLILEQRYKELGGKVEVIHKTSCDHHSHGLDNPQPIVDFVLEHAR
jgi:hypothetical protein